MIEYYCLCRPSNSPVSEPVGGWPLLPYPAEQLVAASLAYLAVKIVATSLPRKREYLWGRSNSFRLAPVQETFLDGPPCTMAETQSMLLLLQSQPRKRGRPRKNRDPYPSRAPVGWSMMSGPASSTDEEVDLYKRRAGWRRQ